jgi:O-antigen/teichoic acid export membrane protein
MRLSSLLEPPRTGGRPDLPRRLHPLVVNTGLNLASHAVFSGSMLVTSILASRALGRSDKGVLALLILVPIILQFILDIGIEHGLTIKAANGSLGTPGRRPVLRGLLVHGSTGLAIASIVAALAPLAGSSSLAALGGRNALLTVTACTLAIVQHDLTGLLYGYNKIPFVSVARMAGALAVAGGSAVLYVLGRNSVTEYFAIYVAGTAGLTAALALQLRTLLPGGPPDPAGGSINWRAVARTGLPFYGAYLSYFAVTRFDSFLLGATRPPAELGLYSNAVNLAEVVWYFPGTLGQVLLSHTGGKGNARLCRRTLLAVVVLSSASVLLLGLSGRLLITTLFGPDFAPSFGPLLILLPGAVGMSCVRIGQIWLLIYGRASLVRTVNAAAAAAGAILWWISIPKYGLTAAATVSSLLYCSMGLVTMLTLTRTVRTQPTDITDP